MYKHKYAVSGFYHTSWKNKRHGKSYICMMSWNQTFVAVKDSIHVFE